MEKLNFSILDGISKYNEGEYENALSIFDSLLSSVGDDILALFYKGNTLGALGNFEESIKCFNKILGIDPKNDKAKKAKEIFKNIKKNSSLEKCSVPFSKYPEENISVASAQAAVPISHSDNSYYIPQKSRNTQELSKKSKEETQTNKSEVSCEVYGGKGSLYNFLKSNEAEVFFQKDELKNLEVDSIIDKGLPQLTDK